MSVLLLILMLQFHHVQISSSPWQQAYRVRLVRNQPLIFSCLIMKPSRCFPTSSLHLTTYAHYDSVVNVEYW